MAAVDGLAEVAAWATAAEGAVRSAGWQDEQAIERASERTDRRLAAAREAFARPALDALAPTGQWRLRLAEMLQPDRDARATRTGSGPDGAGGPSCWRGRRPSGPVTRRRWPPPCGATGRCRPGIRP